MKRVTPDFDFDSKVLEDKFLKLKETLDVKANPAELRDKISSDFSIRKIEPKLSKSETRILSVDSSIVSRELKFAALWAIHSVSLFCVFDNSMHEDPLVGGKEIWYRDMSYNSDLDLGRFERQDEIENNYNYIRIEQEYKSLLNSFQELNSNGIEAEYLLLDGSIYTVLKRIKDNELMKLYDKLKDSGKLIGMVEDSASVSIAIRLGTNLTNIGLFDLILEENEFVVHEKFCPERAEFTQTNLPQGGRFADEKNGINVCYIKLPSKELSYTPSRKSEPLTVRWEFSYPEFLQDLENLVAIWCKEDDLLHPQIYPLRIADYLTRRVKVGGILDRFIRENGLELKHRERREG